MDNLLFKKHIKLFKERDENKTKIIEHIKSKTNIILKENEIKIEKNTVRLSLSSVKKSTLHKHKIEEILKDAGLIYKN